MKLARWLLILVFGLQVFVAVVPFIPFFSRLLPENPLARDVLDLQITIFGIQFAIITGYLGITLWLHERAGEAQGKALLAAINAPEMKLLSEHDFYHDFLAAAKRATVRVDIMYLAEEAPDKTRHEERRNYYDRLRQTIASMPRVRFRRIIRNSEDNRRWLSELLPKLVAKCPNADVGILKESGHEEMPLSLSVQLIDSTHTWFVALQTHEGGTNYRDIYVGSGDFNTAMTGYYERLWDRSECVLRQGRLTAEGERVIEEFRRGEA
jgi:hypothetical protein